MKRAMIKIGTLAREYDMELDTIHALIAKGELPEPQKVDNRSWGFRKSDIQVWDRERNQRR